MACVRRSGRSTDSVGIADAEYKVNTHHLLVAKEEAAVRLCPKALWTQTGGAATVQPLHKLALPQIQALKSKYSITHDLQAPFFKGFATRNL